MIYCIIWEKESQGERKSTELSNDAVKPPSCAVSAPDLTRPVSADDLESLDNISNTITAVPQRRSSSQSAPSQVSMDSHDFYTERFAKSQALYISIAKSLERSIFMIGFAIIISAIIEQKTSSGVGLTPYHTLIILNVSMINNWAGFYLQSTRGGFRTRWVDGKTSWRYHFIITKDSLRSSLWCLAHSTIFNALALYFWISPTSFLNYAKDVDPPCEPVTYFWLFTAIPISHPSLRIGSIIFYSISIIPIYGLYFQSIILLTVGFGMLLAVLAIFTLLGVTYAVWLLIAPVIQWLLRILTTAMQPAAHSFSKVRLVVSLFLHKPYLLVTRMFTATQQFFTVRYPFKVLILTFLAVILLGSPIVYTIISTEEIIRINAPNVDQAPEKAWTYGQTLALLSALIAFGIYVGDWRKTLVGRGDSAEPEDL
jgi:hypothetical protein